MMVSFILMTITWLIMLAIVFIQKRHIKTLQKMLDNSVKPLKVYKRRYKFINIENAGDNDTVNRTVDQFINDGYNYDREGSNSFILAFVKIEEVKDKES